MSAPTNPADRIEPKQDWPPLREAIAVTLWCSFLAASLGALLCFAYIDPAAAGMADRKLAYTIGFFFFWFIGAVAGGLSIFMLRTGPRRRDGEGRAP